MELIFLFVVSLEIGTTLPLCTIIEIVLIGLNLFARDLIYQD